jgi:murein L,D-transpeptidase YafK
MRLLRVYRIAAASGGPGPKRREGDLQVPEGVYEVDRFNPQSHFYLSLGLNYPNKADRIFSDHAKPGGDIFIHGNCVTVGCMPLGDDAIDELYVVALDARAGGQGSIPVHVFPHRMDADWLTQAGREAPELLPFWSQLQPIYDAFEQSHRPPRVSVDPRTGTYRLEPRIRGRCRIPGEGAR